LSGGGAGQCGNLGFGLLFDFFDDFVDIDSEGFKERFGGLQVGNDLFCADHDAALFNRRRVDNSGDRFGGGGDAKDRGRGDRKALKVLSPTCG
jgi:hypothetical protein